MSLLSPMTSSNIIRRMCSNTLYLSNKTLKKLNLFDKKLRQINPKLAPIVKKELEKMLVAGIIAPTRHSSWLQLGGCKKKEWEHKNMYRFLESKYLLSKG